MKTKQDILKEVYDHLRAHHGLHTKTDFAAALHITRPVLSSAMNGNKAYLTKNLFQKICAAYPGIFNLDYLLTGRGELLLPIPRPEGQPVNDVKEVDYTHNLFDLAMQVIKDNESLHRQLKASIAELRSLIDCYGPIIEAYQSSQKNINQYPAMVAEDKDFAEVK